MRAADYLALGAGAFYKENGDWDRATYSPLAGTQAHFGTVNKGYIHYGHHKRYRDAVVFPTRAEVDAKEAADVAATCRAADGHAPVAEHVGAVVGRPPPEDRLGHLAVHERAVDEDARRGGFAGL